MGNKLFVGGISWDTTEDTLRKLFAEVGTVTSVSIIKDRDTGKSKGFGFVEMGNDNEAQQAIQKLNGQKVDDREIAVNEARPQEPRDNNFHGGGGGGNRNFNRGNSRGGGSRGNSRW
jgi:cold-inducible RNA-binding protein